MLILACAAAPPPPPPVDTVVVEPPPSLRVVIDAGHGAPGNPGNTSTRCESEQDFTLRTQDAVLERLEALGGHELRAGRPGVALLPYTDRIAAFEAWNADAVISLHSDARNGDGWLVGENGCWVARGAAGFAVLYSDEGGPERVDGRRRLARAVAVRMIEAGFPAYDGADYPGLYALEEPGVFVDRHAPSKRIRMLRRPNVPLVIVETHQAMDPEEVARWNEPATLDAFAGALHAALGDFAR